MRRKQKKRRLVRLTVTAGIAAVVSVGAYLGFVAFLFGFLRTGGSAADTRFDVPGRHRLEVRRTGLYEVFEVMDAVPELETPEEGAGQEPAIRLVEPDGERREMERISYTNRYDSHEGRRMRLIGYFQIRDRGSYAVEIDVGSDYTLKRPVVMSRRSGRGRLGILLLVLHFLVQVAAVGTIFVCGIGFLITLFRRTDPPLPTCSDSTPYS